MSRRGVLAVVGTLMALAALGLHLTSLDGLDGLLLSAIYGDDTRFAATYSGAAFRSVRVGQSKSQVEQALGRPLSESAFEDGEVTWHYSDSPTGGSFRNRVVRFSADGGVAAVTAEFYVD